MNESRDFADEVLKTGEQTPMKDVHGMEAKMNQKTILAIPKMKKPEGPPSPQAVDGAPAEEVEKSDHAAQSPIATVDKRKELSNKEITDHTANMWKYQPVPIDEPEPAPEYRTVNVSLPGARVIGARVRGKKHKHEGSNCDDWFEVTYFEDVTFVAVSDGAGSKRFSRIGARESCRAAVGYLANEYPNLLAASPELRRDLQLARTDERCMAACGRIAELVQRSVVQAGSAVDAAFYSRSADPDYAAVLNRKLTLNDLSGTLLVSAFVPIQKRGECLIVSCQIGDGMTAAFDTAGAFESSVKLLGVPDSGEFTGETEFLTSPKMKRIEELQKRTKLFIGSADVVLMMSDGVADDYYPNGTQMRRLYYDLIANRILHLKGEKKSMSELSQEEVRLFKKIPDPVAYPWVNDKSVLVPIQYASRICSAMELSLEELWDHREILSLAALEMKGPAVPENDVERLNQWLDNYYERGSFDDRTLVVVELQEVGD